MLRGIAFSLEPGGALLVHGPNGAGKSTLLRVLALLLPATRGRMLWDGAPVADDPESHRARCRYLGHADGVNGALTAAEHLAFWWRLAGGAGSGLAEVGRGLAAMGLEDLADLPGRMLSAGQRRRLALARLLAAPAPLWLLDEPGVGLDAEAEDRLAVAAAAHRAGGGMVIASTHQPLALERAATLVLTPVRGVGGGVGGSVVGGADHDPRDPAGEWEW